MNKQNFGSTPRHVALIVTVLLLGMTAQGAWAAGTASGTTISNSASIAYSIGGFGQSSIASPATTFLVDNKVNLTVIGSGVDILPNSTNQVLYFSVSNNGNTAQSYALSPIAGAFTASMNNVRIFNDNGATPGVYDGTNTLYVAGAATIAPDSSFKVLIVADQAATTASNAQTAVYSLLAQTTNAGTSIVTASDAAAADLANTVQAVWADLAGSAGAGTDNVADGKHSAAATYTVAITLPTLVKSATVLCDPFTAVLSNAKNIPGAITQWSVLINNPGTVPITLTNGTDLLMVANLAMDPGAAAGLNVPSTASNCVAGAEPYGFKVTVLPAARVLGGSLAGASGLTSYFTSTSTADGVDFVTPNISAQFNLILPVDAGHTSAGLLNAGESVTIMFNTILN